MPQNFDEVLLEDRTFVIAGETFEWRYLHWRKWAEGIDSAAEEFLSSVVKKESDSKDDSEEEPARQTLVESIEDIIDRICEYLVPDDVERFRQVASRSDNPISWPALEALRDWLREVQSGRPTEPPSTSSPGRGRAAATSKAS